MKPPVPHVVRDRRPGHSQRNKLATSNHAVLASRQRGDRPATLLTFFATIANKLRNVRGGRPRPRALLTLFAATANKLRNVRHGATMAQPALRL